MRTMGTPVFIVEDDDAAREGLQDLAESVGLKARAFPSAEEFLDSYDPAWRGCLLLDVRMPGMSGLRLQEKETVTKNVLSKLGLLTSREREILDCVKAGKRAKLIALEPGLSRKTVDGHLSMIRQKMGVESSNELILLLGRAGQS